MMPSVVPLLKEIFDEVPLDLVAYFDRIAGRSFFDPRDIELNLLSISDAIEMTKVFRGFHPIVQALDGFVLDDPDTSDHHVYLAGAPLIGTVLFLSHDGDTHVVFPSLAEFLDAAEVAEREDCPLTDMHPALSPLAIDQAALNEFIRRQLDADEGILVITAVIPSMDRRDLALLQRLAGDEDFFLGEAVANEIAKRPAAELREIADLCLRHRHPQVVSAGRQASAALDALA